MPFSAEVLTVAFRRPASVNSSQKTSRTSRSCSRCGCVSIASGFALYWTLYCFWGPSSARHGPVSILDSWESQMSAVFVWHSLLLCVHI